MITDRVSAYARLCTKVSISGSSPEYKLFGEHTLVLGGVKGGGHFEGHGQVFFQPEGMLSDGEGT